VNDNVSNTDGRREFEFESASLSERDREPARQATSNFRASLLPLGSRRRTGYHIPASSQNARATVFSISECGARSNSAFRIPHLNKSFYEK